ncbi:sporulation protein [Streptomyces wuyuanensis]|uniref:Sporulation-control protein n=1 Tax=Streptomyces wuyuanensis TaxID=1196353 RepID=A0A1G9Y8Z3_9ACTN|nr:sporulation protein [Streptomyces wuyuanensis]SDN05497.1 sporulation-control protein [Streptomyces wuyuanensis]
MVFKKLCGSLGVGPTVHMALDAGPALPGGSLTGQVHLNGGNADFDIERITLELVARVGAATDGSGTGAAIGFKRFSVAGGLRLAEGEQRSIPFRAALPWEVPITELYGQPLGIGLGVRTELVVAGVKSKGDVDPLMVRPLPVQEAILDTLGQLGFGLRSADLEYGHIHGTGQLLPFYQEIKLTSAPRYKHVMRELEVTFLANAGGTEVVLEADKPRGFFTAGYEVVNRHVVSHEGATHRDWNAVVHAWIRQMTATHGHHTIPAPHGHGDPHGGRSRPWPSPRRPP